MANRNLYPIAGSLDPGLVILAGRIGLSAAGAVVAARTVLRGAAVTKPGGAGLYTITLEDKWTKILSVQVSMMKAAASVLDVEVVADANGEPVVPIQLRTINGSTGAALDAAAVCGIAVVVVAKNSVV